MRSGVIMAFKWNDDLKESKYLWSYQSLRSKEFSLASKPIFRPLGFRQTEYTGLVATWKPAWACWISLSARCSLRCQVFRPAWKGRPPPTPFLDSELNANINVRSYRTNSLFQVHEICYFQCIYGTSSLSSASQYFTASNRSLRWNRSLSFGLNSRTN